MGPKKAARVEAKGKGNSKFSTKRTVQERDETEVRRREEERQRREEETEKEGRGRRGSWRRSKWP